MIRPETDKWGQTLADLRRLSVEAEHPRTRERFLALYHWSEIKDFQELSSQLCIKNLKNLERISFVTLNFLAIL